MDNWSLVNYTWTYIKKKLQVGFLTSSFSKHLEVVNRYPAMVDDGNSLKNSSRFSISNTNIPHIFLTHPPASQCLKERREKINDHILLPAPQPHSYLIGNTSPPALPEKWQKKEQPQPCCAPSVKQNGNLSLVRCSCPVH